VIVPHDSARSSHIFAALVEMGDRLGALTTDMLVEGIDFITGGMTAEYGDYMSGVVGLQSRIPTPDDEYRNGVGVSFVSLYGRTSGVFADDCGSWQLAARRGFLDVLMDRVMDEGEQLTPRYTDVFVSTNFEINERSSVAARMLFSDDDLRLVTTDGTNDVDSAGTGRSAHLWLTFDHAWTDALQMNTVLSVATVNQHRDSFGEDEHRVGTVYADNNFRFLDLKQDWSWQVGDRHLPRWGFNIGDQTGDYDYSLQSTIFDPLITPVPVMLKVIEGLPTLAPPAAKKRMPPLASRTVPPAWVPGSYIVSSDVGPTVS
jgi:hypothetical protein